MSRFPTEQAANDAFGTLFTELLSAKGVADGLRDNDLSVFFRHSEPSCLVHLSPDGVAIGARADLPATHRFHLSSDTAHEIWLGRTSLASALTGGRVTIFGKTASVPDLLTLLWPAFELYPRIATDLRIPD